MAEILTPIDRDKMTRKQKDKFANMCMKLLGEPSELDGTGEVRCSLGDRVLTVSEDFERANVRTKDARTNPDQIQGSIEDVNQISMSMIGEPEKDDELAKSIDVHSEKGKLSITNHDSPKWGGKKTSSRK